MSNFVTEPATRSLGEEWAGMTFPFHRHLLGLLGTGASDPKGVTPVARYALVDGQPAGLILAELPTPQRPSAELLSMFVVPEQRGRGLATSLLEGLEADLANAGVSELIGTYMTGKPSISAIERIFVKRGFTPPELRKIVVKYTPEEPSRALWYRRAKMPSHASIFPWVELTPEERDALKRSQSETAWIPPLLEPWRSDKVFDEVSSFGMRRHGEVVGWVINHRVQPDLVRFTTSFMRPDMQRLGAIFPLYVASLKSLEGSGITCVFVTSAEFANMVQFALRRVAPFVHYTGETRGVSKALSASSRAVGSLP